MTYWRLLASGFSWLITNGKPEDDHGLAVEFALCSSCLNSMKSFQWQAIYGKVFLPSKIVEPLV